MGHQESETSNGGPDSEPLTLQDVKARVGELDILYTNVELGLKRSNDLATTGNEGVTLLTNAHAALRLDFQKRFTSLEKLIMRTTAPMNALMAYIISDGLGASQNATIAATVVTLVVSTSLPEVSAAMHAKLSSVLEKFVKKNVPVEVTTETPSIAEAAVKKSSRPRDISQH